MTAREMAEYGCRGFDGILEYDVKTIFNGGQVIERVLAVAEREDSRPEKAICFGLCGFTGIYLLGSILRVLS